MIRSWGGGVIRGLLVLLIPPPAPPLLAPVATLATRGVLPPLFVGVPRLGVRAGERAGEATRRHVTAATSTLPMCTLALRVSLTREWIP